MLQAPRVEDDPVVEMWQPTITGKDKNGKEEQEQKGWNLCKVKKDIFEMAKLEGFTTQHVSYDA
eukprot:2256045-Pleurochrysis_carterae.AAC.1